MKVSDLIIIAEGAIIALPLAEIVAADDASRWLAINSVCTPLIGELGAAAHNPELVQKLRMDAERLAAELRQIQRTSCQNYDRCMQLAA